MTLDRRTFTRTLALASGAAIAGFPGMSEAATPHPQPYATLIADAATGRILHRSGACATRHSPLSTFKIPLALIGFDSGILTDAHTPAWDYDPKIHDAHRPEEKQRTDPTTWESNSVVWYSQQLTTKLGAAKFKAYVDRFGYGNRDVSGGLTQAWLGSSLAISADEQVAFLRRMLAHKLVSAKAHQLAESVVPQFEGSGGWSVHGKTGSGVQTGWFVGWATKGKRRIVFARVGTGAEMQGSVARTAMLKEIGRLAG